MGGDRIPTWRTLDWGKKNEQLEWLKSYHLGSGDPKHLRVLLCGPSGSGKSSFINSVASTCQNQYTEPAEVGTGIGTFTLKYKTHRIQRDGPGGQHYPFVFNDLMGLEEERGILLEDIKLAMKGHVREDYKFDQEQALDDSNDSYIKKPTLNDKAHILVFVVAVDFFEVAGPKIIQKMAEVKLAARDLGIRTMAILTKIDEKSSPLVKKDLKYVYSSKFIKNAVENLSQNVGFPVSCIFPLKNYHAENGLKDEVDILILSALRKIIDLGNYCENDSNVELMTKQPTT
ncbi:interferon-induced protein 44-like isoform X2 [Gadus chalcogrammus]|uniref:interferon-induced protein 44-like isoform X2 n=1 Tax=Gadus chalcogrammus TaxID=1042646 RepID=UPI0024C370E0|nr:interferon-induced protein 44-like isoform X2 [Gadus chalcogrammus]